MAASAQRNRLGRGLASLIGEPANMEGINLPAEGEQRIVAIDQVRPSDLNPRTDFNEAELEELASSIREKGLVQPLIVRPGKGPEGGFEIVAGERRWRAAQLAGHHTIPVIVRDLVDQEVLELAIIENVQRTDLNAIEEALGYRELVDKYSYTQEDLAKVIGKSRSHLANTLRLLKLPPRVQAYVRDGELTAGHVRALIGVEDAEFIARKIVDKGLNVREVEALIQKTREGKTSSSRKRQEKDPDTMAYEKELSDSLGLAVQINSGVGESGEIRVKYSTLDQLEDVCSRLMQTVKS
jgi:ParB family chromosome partitioning protein